MDVGISTACRKDIEEFLKGFAQAHREGGHEGSFRAEDGAWLRRRSPRSKGKSAPTSRSSPITIPGRDRRLRTDSILQFRSVYYRRNRIKGVIICRMGQSYGIHTDWKTFVPA
jgi:hypothetical protein